MLKLLVTGIVVRVLAFPVHFAAADTAAPELKSRNTATLLSFGGTLTSIGVIAFGGHSANDPLTAAGLVSALIAPSAGQIYAGEVVTVGMGIRAAAIGAGVGGYQMLLDCLTEGGTCRHGALSITLITAGLVGYTTGAMYDVATAGAAVDRHNRRVQLQVAPILATASGPAVGIGLGGSF